MKPKVSHNKLKKDFAILMFLLVPDAEHSLSQATKKGGGCKRLTKSGTMTRRRLLAEFRSVHLMHKS